MIQFNSVFNMEVFRIHPDRSHLLIVTSRDCAWCHKFKPLWREVEEAVKERYTVYGVEVDDIGGGRVFLEGVWYFLAKQLPYRLGYPSFYKINVSKGQVDLVDPPVYWNAEEKSFNLKGLIAHLLEEEEQEE